MRSEQSRSGFGEGTASAAEARRFVTATLEEWGRDNLVDVAVLLVGELVANVVLHAGTRFEVLIRLGDKRLRIEVRDGDVRMPVRKYYSATSTTGRGLLMVEELSAGWGADPTADGKSVWFELEKEAPDALSDLVFDLGDLGVDEFTDTATLYSAEPPPSVERPPGSGRPNAGPNFHPSDGGARRLASASSGARPRQ